jgi:ribosomal protein S18 acetylase RimI-like enzyme
METVSKKILVTYMQAVAPPQTNAELPPSYSIEQARLSTVQYLEIYRRVGTQVNWDSRLKLSELELNDLLSSTDNFLLLLSEANSKLGFCEFTIRNNDIELTHFGIVPEAQGRGLAFAFLSKSLEVLWQQKPKRVWLHTDEWDSPKAQELYSRMGFVIYEQRREDPEPL